MVLAHMAVEYVPVLRSISPKYSILYKIVSTKSYCVFCGSMMASEINNTVIAALKVNIVIIT